MVDQFEKEVKRLPVNIFAKSIRRGNEFGWRQSDFIEVIEAARRVPMAIIGGQVQYALPDGTCELYWLSYDPENRKNDEGWITYCNRTADECITKFNLLISTKDIESEALDSFVFLLDKKNSEIDISQYQIFILYFDDSEIDYYVDMPNNP